MSEDHGQQDGGPAAPAAISPSGSPVPSAPPAEGGGRSWWRESAQLVRGAGHLLTRRWLVLSAIAATSLLAHELLSQLAVRAGVVGGVPGFLTLALVPLAGLAALVAMLLVVRGRGARRSNPWGVIAAAGSVLVPYLVVYESRGDLRADLIDYVRGTLYEQLGSETAISGLPQIASWLVLGIVATALVVRAVGTRLIRDGRWVGREGPRRGIVHLVLGYAEAVWMTLGAWVLTGVLSGLGAWWAGRSLARALADHWSRVREHLPSLGALGDWLREALPVVTDAVVTGVVVPVSMLTIAVIVYGLQVADGVSGDDVVGVVRRSRWAPMTRRVGDAPLRQAWARLSDTEGHFGALIGGLALVTRSAFAPVLVYCMLFTLLAQVDVVIWWVARLLLGWRSEMVWEGLYAPLVGVSELVTLVLTVALTAVFADRLLVRFGAAAQLDDRRRRSLRTAAAAR